MKKEIVVVMVAFVLCSFFGIGYLAIFSDEPLVNKLVSSKESIHIYVNQVGVYSTKENAENASQNIASIVKDEYYVLNKNDQYVLLSLITTSKEEVEEQGQALENLNISYYTKEYDVSSDYLEEIELKKFDKLIQELESR